MTAGGTNTETSDLPPIGMLWVGKTLSWVAAMSMRSFMKQGHKVTLFHTDTPDMTGLEDVDLVPAREIFDYSDSFLASARPQVFADIFRLTMVRDTDMIWSDLDVLCYRPFAVRAGYLVGYEYPGADINNGVLRLPKDSPALNELIACFSDPAYVPEWLPKRALSKVMALPENERLLGASEIITPLLGPRALTYMLIKHGEDQNAVPFEVLNPVPWVLNDVFFNPHGGLDGWITKHTMGLHLYSSKIRRGHKKRVPLVGSFMAEFAEDIGFDFAPYGLTPRSTPRQTEWAH